MSETAAPPPDIPDRPLIASMKLPRQEVIRAATMTALKVDDDALKPVFSEAGVDQVLTAMLNIMGEVREIPKLGFNKHDKYEYMRWNDVAIRLQDAQLANNIVITQRELPDKRAIVHGVLYITCAFDVWHASGQFVINMHIASGSCRALFQRGTADDKAAFKATTSCTKAGMTSMFRIPALDGDVERDNIDDILERRRDNREQGGRARDRGREPDDYGAGEGETRRQDRRPPPDDEWGGPPPPAAPFEGDQVEYGPPSGNPPAGDASRGPTRSAEDEARALIAKIRNARTSDEADTGWRDHWEFTQKCSDATYEHIAGIFRDKWKVDPPRS